MLIGVTGKARSGKDTVADRLVDQYGFNRFTFARPLKEAIKIMFDLSDDHVDGHLKEEVVPWIGKSPRELMQSLGTEWARDHVSPEIWINVLAVVYSRAVVAHQKSGVGSPFLAVVTDVRFDNEAQWIRSMGGIVVQVVRDIAPDVRSHVSEAGVSLVNTDLLIKNNGTLDELFCRVDDAVRLMFAEA